MDDEMTETYIRGQRVIPPMERLEALSMPEPNSGCWLWLGTVRENPSGLSYGRLVVGSRTQGTRRSVSAHRYAYEVYCGQIPAGLCVCHRCDNPMCINPKHLFLGTQQENIEDRERKGRNNHVSGESVGTAKLRSSQVLAIRTSTLSLRHLGRLYGVDRATIRSIKQMKSWVSLPPPPPEK